MKCFFRNVNSNVYRVSNVVYILDITQSRERDYCFVIVLFELTAMIENLFL